MAEHTRNYIDELLEQLTPVQRDIIELVALPQLLGWSDRWQSPSIRQEAIAHGLIRRGLLQELTDLPQCYGATALGLRVGLLSLQLNQPEELPEILLETPAVSLAL